jgi:hypothetical protein
VHSRAHAQLEPALPAHRRTPALVELARASAVQMQLLAPAALRAGLETYALRLAFVLGDGAGGAFEMVRRLANVEKKAWADKNKIVAGGDPEAVADEKDEDGAAVDIPSHLVDKATSAYTTFFKAFGKNIKLGVIEDQSNRSKLAKLLRFVSSKSIETEKAGTSGPFRSLEEYVAGMAPGQKQIYFIAGESLEAIKQSPFLEKMTAKKNRA